MIDPPKYSLIEVERRWLVDLAEVQGLNGIPYREIEDLYITDSRLRLRKMSGPATEAIYKLCKKYGKQTRLSEPITNLYLTESEYRTLSTLQGIRSLKRRYSLANGALDVYLSPCSGFGVFEIEFQDEHSAAAYKPPPFVTREITDEPEFSGIALASHDCAQ